MIETSGDEIEIKYLHDVAYQSADGATLRLSGALSHVAQTASAGPLPCIVFVMGSAWRAQKLYMLIPQLAQIARRVCGAEVEYRPASQAAFPAQIQDCQNAVRHMRAHADEFGIDPEKIIVAGNS